MEGEIMLGGTFSYLVISVLATTLIEVILGVLSPYVGKNEHTLHYRISGMAYFVIPALSVLITTILFFVRSFATSMAGAGILPKVITIIGIVMVAFIAEIVFLMIGVMTEYIRADYIKRAYYRAHHIYLDDARELYIDFSDDTISDDDIADMRKRRDY